MKNIEAYFKGFSTLSDGSMNLRFQSQEAPSETLSELRGLINSYGWLLFITDPEASVEVPKEMPQDDSKTSSERLRGVIFVLWKQRGEKENFDTFYKTTMEALINVIKNKLDA